MRVLTFNLQAVRSIIEPRTRDSADNTTVVIKYLPEYQMNRKRWDQAQPEVQVAASRIPE